MRRYVLALLGLMLAFAAPTQAALLFNTNATWKYFKGRSEASTPNTAAWRGIIYDDSSWLSGAAPFYYGESLSGTLLDDMRSGYTCIFMRRTFVLTNLAEISALTLNTVTDDGHIVWINGTEMTTARFNMPAGDVPYSGDASSAIEGTPNGYTFASPNFLVLGTNLIAIQAFNDSLNDSSDFVMTASLSTTAPDPTPPTIASVTPTPGTVNGLSQITVVFSEPVNGVNAADLLINGQPATSMSGGNDTYTFSFTQPAYGAVQISWIAGHGITDFGIPANSFNAIAPGSTWQYALVDNIAPTVAFQLPFAGVTVRSLTQIEVNFSEAVTGVDAADLLVNSTPASSVTPMSSSRFVFQFTQPAVGSVQVAFAGGHGIRDLANPANNFAGGSWTYVLDPNAVLTSVRINEISAANITGLRDEDNEPQDWVELFNTSSNTISLAGWSLTDDEDEPEKWVFPPVSIAGRGYLIVFCSGKDRKPTTPGSRLHSNFSLSPDGEFLGLYNAEVPRTLVSSFNPFPNQRNDYSWGYDPQDQLKYFQSPTAGAANGASTITGIVADTKFSHDRGFYTSAFSLSITCATPGVTIRYTTNGAAPTASTGLLYSGPFPVQGTKIVRAAAFKTGLLSSDVDAQTYIFLDDVIRQADEVAPPGWPAQKKATGSGQVWDYGMDPQIVSNATWSANIKNDLLAIPTFSITMDIGAFTNIYNNPGGDGIANERPASLELLYPDGVPGFQANCGIRIRGGFSRSPDNPKHAFRLFFRQEYGLSKLQYPVFGPTGADEFDKFDLRTMQNYSWAFQNDSRMVCVRDVMSRDAQLAMNGLSTRGNFYHLYINGVYWGLYNSEERPEAAFAESYLGGNADDYDVIKQLDGYLSGATDGNEQAWYRLWQAATNGFASDLDYYKVQGLNPDGSVNPAYENLLDVPNLIDYMLVILYGGNLDAPISNFLGNDSPNNWYGFRDRTGNHGGFRFVSHDAEHTLLNVNEDRTGITDLASTGNQYGVINPDWTCGNPLTQSGGAAAAIQRSTPQYIWFRLHQNAEFRMLAADRIQKHCFNRGPLSVEGMRSAFLARSNELQRAIVAESARWGDAKTGTPYTRDTWVAAYNTVGNSFIPGRTTVLVNQLRADGLFPNVNAPIFNSPGGAVPAGFAFYMTNSNPAGSQILYTTDGTDPRLRGGNISGSAISYTPGTPILINFPTTIRARVRSGVLWSAIVEATFYPAQDLGNLLVTEIMYNPTAFGITPGDELEFFELKNTGTTTLDLSGATFSGISFTFTNGTRLAPGAFFVLGRNRTALVGRYPGLTVHGIFTGRLDNAGEAITLTHPLGSEIFSVEYKDGGKWPLTPDGFGYSLVPKNPNSNPQLGNPAGWRASTNPGGSPGADDPASTVPTILVNEALTHTDLPLVDSIELHNPTASEVNLSGWFLTDDGKTPTKFRIPDGTTIAAGGYLVFTEAQFNPTPGTNNSFNLNSHGEEVYVFSGTPGVTNLTGYSHGFNFGAAENGVSFGRHVISTGDERFVAQISRTLGSANSGPKVGPVVIREIMYHPPDLAGGLDNSTDEYIQLRNMSAGSVQLFDPAAPTNTWHLRGGVDFDLPQSLSLGAGQSLLLVNFPPSDPIALATFRAKYPLFAATPTFGPFSGKLNNGSDTVSLERPDSPDTNTVPYILVDEVDYKDSAPWPITPDGGGAALQRLNLNAYADDPANWVGAAPLTIVSFGPMNPQVRPGTSPATASNITFSVSAYGTGTVTYQWRRNGTNIPGATTTELYVDDVQLEDEGVYTVVVTDLNGSIVSTPTSLLVLVNPAIVAPPVSVSVVSGGPVSLSAVISGNPAPFNYEWRRTTQTAFTNFQTSNERTSFYNYTAPIVTSGASLIQTWRFVVKNAANSTPGVAAPTINVTVLADADGDGIPDQWEIAYGLGVSNALDAAFDLDGDGMKNRDEYIAGTDPANPASYLKVEPITVNSPAQISFQAISNRTYTVQFNDNLSSGVWQRLADVIARPTNRLETVTDPGPVTNRLYRIATPYVP